MKQQASAPTKSTQALPEIVSGQYDDDEFEYATSSKPLVGSSAGTGKGGVSAEDLDELDGMFNFLVLFLSYVL